MTFFSVSVSTKDFLERPLAGKQVQLCLLDTRVLNSWSHIDPGTFRVRGSNYFRYMPLFQYQFIWITVWFITPEYGRNLSFKCTFPGIRRKSMLRIMLHIIHSELMCTYRHRNSIIYLDLSNFLMFNSPVDFHLFWW